MSCIVNSILFHCILFCSIVFYKCGTPSSEEIKRSRFFPYHPRRAELYRRYIDDIVRGASCRREELEAFVNFVANFNPALQFTSTVFEIKLPFLDISLRISDIRIQTSVHYKGTDTHNYLHFSSFHPQHCKCSIPYSQFLGLRWLLPWRWWPPCAIKGDGFFRGILYWPRLSSFLSWKWSTESSNH